MLPSLDATGDAGGTKQSYHNGIPADFVPKGWNDRGSAALSFGFDIDLWGKNRAALRAATSDAVAARLDLDQARLLISTNIASAYADLARLHAERDVQLAAIALRISSQKLVADRVATGLDTRAELKQADAAVPAARAELAALDESIALTHNRIAALMGEGTGSRPLHRAACGDGGGARPARRRDHRSDRPPARYRGPRGRGWRRPLTGSRRRAPISIRRSACRRWRAIESLGLSNLLKSGSSYGNAGAAVSLPIFHGGEISSRYRTARATYDEAVASCDRSVADAFHEVADAVTSQTMLAERLAQSAPVAERRGGGLFDCPPAL